MNRKPNIVYILNDHQAWYGHGMAQGGPKPMRPNFEKLRKNPKKNAQSFKKAMYKRGNLCYNKAEEI